MGAASVTSSATDARTVGASAAFGGINEVGGTEEIAARWSTQADAIVHIARSWIGTPYHHQASLKGVGCDCFGLVRGVWRELYDAAEPEDVPTYSRDWAEATGEETMIEAARRHMIEIAVADARAGDVMIFRLRDYYVAKHSVILTGSGRMIHATEGTPVCEVHLSAWWLRHAGGAFRFPLLDDGVKGA